MLCVCALNMENWTDNFLIFLMHIVSKPKACFNKTFTCIAIQKSTSALPLNGRIRCNSIGLQKNITWFSSMWCLILCTYKFIFEQNLKKMGGMLEASLQLNETWASVPPQLKVFSLSMTTEMRQGALVFLLLFCEQFWMPICVEHVEYKCLNKS